MGCTQSTPADDDATRNLMNSGADPSRHSRRGRGGQGQPMPLLHDRPEWTAPEPMTQADLDAQRAAFWETAPTYEGRLEVWQALQLVCQPDTDHATAQVILDSVGASLPTGRLADGVFDSLGNRYRIPDYCLSAPTNLVAAPAPSAATESERAVVITTRPASSGDAAKPTAEAGAAVVAASDTAEAGRAIKLTVRLTTNEDVVLEMRANDQLYPQVTHALLAARPPVGHDDAAKDKDMQVHVRYMRLGRVLRGEQRLAELLPAEESSMLLQAMVHVMPSAE
ncbi:hypothetical protein SYNPS1DRAFT_29943 [Syncephalis pseudoplumigaleata]|uniref:DC-UbP/UBTD2 N-terminal domain-containing protein n=1 Tax=Syncephalis pseudoplumigaleata TaxID=1712513 RepID=A0A4P9YW29_9FUNG|nr:hypothetical protein SYNPS1DRAFT_29943 [Syncephalis pseudoplumigaleata]|eukprot:RKP24293.1 hypothetical protein SYNPS1DRAFT_29943 [Syncephalis pseudoplumigaleata]